MNTQTTFATWHDGEAVCVVTNDGPEQRHETIATLGYADSRREATALLTGAGYVPAGRWHCDPEGRTWRPLRHEAEAARRG